jgi:hypothetical protein
VISMARIEILYFLEDRAQEVMITALVERVGAEFSFDENMLHHVVLSGRGGSRELIDFEKFMKDTQQVNASSIDLLIVAIDGNCKGYTKKLRELKKNIGSTHPFKEKVIFAIPDPHIERWYLLDQRAFKEGVGVARAPDLPDYKCDKDYYKNLLLQSLLDSDIKPLLGGTEYAESIVEKIVSLDLLKKRDPGFDNFIEELQSFFRNFKRN